MRILNSFVGSEKLLSISFGQIKVLKGIWISMLTIKRRRDLIKYNTSI